MKQKHDYCTMCGQKLDMWDKEKKFYFDKYIGFGSKYDLEHIHFDLCCECFDKVMDKVLPMFNKAPMEEYDIISFGLKEEISHKLSYILRHNPLSMGLTANKYGYVKVNELIDKLKGEFIDFDFDYLKDIVDTDSKHRYSFNEDFTLIKASYGHSIKYDLKLSPVSPPDVLYHGTAEKYIDSILKDGLLKQSREYVHLTDNLDNAVNVGNRHGKVVLLKIDSKKMSEDGYLFFKPTDNIYLTDNVPIKYIEVIK